MFGFAAEEGRVAKETEVYVEKKLSEAMLTASVVKQNQSKHNIEKNVHLYQTIQNMFTFSG